jgi:uncharacterized protein (UPF0333 family)
MKKKGQAAMEYLMTYGWAILIVIIVVAALWAMGVFTVTSPVACSPCLSYFAFRDYQGGTLLIVNGPESILIDNVSANNVDLLNTTSPTTVSPGQQITITGLDTTSGTTESLVITYNITGGLPGHTDTATIHNS